MPEPNDRILLGVEDLARELALSPQRTRDLLRAESLCRAFKVGRKWYALRRDFERWCERRARRGAGR